MLDFSPVVGVDDASMAEQARTLMALRASDPAWKALIERAYVPTQPLLDRNYALPNVVRVTTTH